MDPAEQSGPPAQASPSRQQITAASLLAQFHATKSPSCEASRPTRNSPSAPPCPSASPQPSSLPESDPDKEQDQPKPVQDTSDQAEQSQGQPPPAAARDSRSQGARRSLRSRESLPLSPKALLNLARGLKDPRSPSQPIQKAPPRLRPNSAAQEILERSIRAKEEVRQRRNAWLTAHKELFLPLLEENNFFTKMSSTQAMHTTKEQSANRGIDEHADSELAIAFENLQTQPNGVLPELRPHQLVGLSFLVWLHKNSAAGILGDEMGLGKTLQALSLLQWIQESKSDTDKGKVHLILAPLSVVDVWINEAESFVPLLRVMRFQGQVTKRHQQQREFTQDRKGNRTIVIAIASYEIYERDAVWFNRQEWSWVIMDEGHRLKNKETSLGMRINGLRSESRLILTGTPIQNNMYELWSLLKCLFKEVFSDKSAKMFKDAYDLKRAGAYSAPLIASSKNLLELIMLRRTKTSPEVGLSLPTPVEISLSVPLTPYQRRLYKARVAGETSFALSNSQGDTWQRLLNLLMQLRQISIHPYAAADIDVAHDVSVLDASGKFIVLQKLVEHHVLDNGEKMIVFSCFTRVLDFVEDLLHETLVDVVPDVEWLRIDGATPRARRTLNVKLFQQSEKAKIILVSVRSGGTGLTLTAAKNVVFLDEDFNPQMTEQACARAHRIGQDKEVTVYKLYSKGTVEEQFLNRTTKKRLLCQQIMHSFQNMNVQQGNDASDAEIAQLEPSLSVSKMWSILKSGTKSLNAAPDITVKEMLGWSMSTILETCTMVFSDDAEDEDCSGDEDKDVSQFFQASSMADTSLFEGKKHKKRKSGSATQPKTEGFLDRKSRRKGKEVVVPLDGYYVSKASLACTDGEAVATEAGKDASLRSRTRAPRPVFGHENNCCFCKAAVTVPDTSRHCTDCPRAMHAACLAKARPGQQQKVPRCPGHECYECGLRTMDAGGLLFRCIECYRAYCDEHLVDERSELVGARYERWEQLGFDEKDSIYFVRCKHCARTLKRKATTFDDPDDELND